MSIRYGTRVNSLRSLMLYIKCHAPQLVSNLSKTLIYFFTFYRSLPSLYSLWALNSINLKTIFYSLQVLLRRTFTWHFEITLTHDIHIKILYDILYAYIYIEKNAENDTNDESVVFLSSSLLAHWLIFYLRLYY